MNVSNKFLLELESFQGRDLVQGQKSKVIEMRERSSHPWGRGTNPTGIHDDAGPVGGGVAFHPWLHSVGGGSSMAVSYDVGCRCSSDPTLLWLWPRPAIVAPI